MSDDPTKIVRLQTGYSPEDPPPQLSDVQELQWAISLLADEVKQLSVLLSKQVRGMATLNDKLNQIQKQLKEK